MSPMRRISCSHANIATDLRAITTPRRGTDISNGAASGLSGCKLRTVIFPRSSPFGAVNFLGDQYGEKHHHICSSGACPRCSVRAGRYGKEVVVHYGDLNVTTSDGAQVLYTREQPASAEICGYQPAISDISAMQAFKACRRAARARAIKTLPFDLSARIENKAESVAAR